MARRKKILLRPTWFSLSNYAEARDMDAADWYVNLLLRGHIRHATNGSVSLWTAQVRKSPILLRRTAHSNKIAFLASISDDLDPDIAKILNGDEPTPAVYSVNCTHLYIFERMLPEPIRKFGRKYDIKKHTLADAPPGFAGPVDHAFSERMLGLFARIDLSKPDDIIVDDLRDFIAAKRLEFEQIDKPQPYRDALRALGPRNAARLRTLAKHGILPFIDLQQWLYDTAQTATNADMAEMLDVSDDDFRHTRRYAKDLLNGMYMRGWLTAPARAAIRKTGK